MDNLHLVQMDILRELTFRSGANFGELNLKKLSTDQFSYHLKVLTKQGYVVKSDDGYVLTDKGKSYVGHMDTDAGKIEKLPKVSVLIIPVKKFGKQVKYLQQTRTKEPYFGYSGFMTGKLRFGETVAEGAARELAEETGLTAHFTHCYILHEMVYDKTGKQLEDKFFHVVEATDVQGELLVETPDGKNSWSTEEEFRRLPNLFHNEIEIWEWYKDDFKGFQEKKYMIDGF